MGKGTIALICLAVLAGLGIGALLGGGPGEDPAPASAAALASYPTARPAMRAVAAARPQGARARRPPASGPPTKQPKEPKITDLITTDPVTVEGSSGRIAVLSCKKSQGIALDGGVIAPPAPAQVLVSVLSRANPNPPFANSPRLYYVGVRNLDPAPTTFRATLVCAKGIKAK